jgi:hypothetical protein
MLKLALLLPLTACLTTRVETMSHPTMVRLHLAESCAAGAVLEHYRDGDYRAIAVEAGAATVEVPAMNGGYSERGGHKSNIHEPRDYMILRLRRGERVVRELSLDQVDALPKDADGRAVVGC